MRTVLMQVGLPFLSFALTALSVPLMQRLALRFGFVAMPYGESPHLKPTPLLGGAGMIGAILISLAIARALPEWMLIGTTGLFTIGLIDDATSLRPLRKFVMQVAAVLIVIALAPHYGLTPWPWLSEALAAFWLVSTINAFNLVDGLDGLAAGVGIAAALAVTFIGVVHGDATLTYQGLAIAGALGGFLLCNLHPATIFMGDAGALPLGLLLGAVALHAGGLAASSRLSRYAVPILIMLVPLLDTAIVSVSRLATGNAVSRRGLDHSHHRLLAFGLSVPRAVAVCWSVALLAALCAVTLAAMPHAYVVAVLPFIVTLFALCGLFMIDLTFDSHAPGIAYGYLQGLARFILSLSYKRRFTDAGLDLVLITAAYFGAFLIRFDFMVDDGRVALMLASLPRVIVATWIAFLFAGVYRGIWRYASFSDVWRFANGCMLAGLLVVLWSMSLTSAPSRSITALYIILLFNLVAASRLSFRGLRKAVALLAARTDRVLIVGAGEMAEAAARYIVSSRSQNLRLVGFADDDNFKLGKFVHGYKVLGTIEELAKIHAGTAFNQILVAAEMIAGDRIALVRAFANAHQLAVRRFSIRLNEMGISAEPASAGRAPLELKSQANEVVA